MPASSTSRARGRDSRPWHLRRVSASGLHGGRATSESAAGPRWPPGRAASAVAGSDAGRQRLGRLMAAHHCRASRALLKRRLEVAGRLKVGRDRRRCWPASCPLLDSSKSGSARCPLGLLSESQCVYWREPVRACRKGCDGQDKGRTSTAGCMTAGQRPRRRPSGPARPHRAARDTRAGQWQRKRACRSCPLG